MAYDAANITFDHERILQNFVEHGVPKEKVRVRGRVTVRVRARVGVSLTLTLALTLALTEARVEQPVQLLEQAGLGLAALRLGQPALRAQRRVVVGQLEDVVAPGWG